ncbi:MAG: type IX secretion system PorP/SprF family membrane protein [Flavobacteriales bacterium]|jgi:type IX secretion system PorP/SprF family membrane protein
MKMMKTKWMVILLLAITANNYFGQQKPMFTMYSFNPMSYNPGYAGSQNAINATLVSRFQWVKFDGSPMSQSLTVHSPLKNKKLGVGMTILNDKIGSSNNLVINADFSYTIKLNSNNDKLAFGLKGGIGSYRNNFSSLLVHDATDEVYNAPISGKINPNFGFGLYYHGKRHYVGLALPQLIPNQLTNSGSQIASYETSHLFLTAGYVFEMNSIWDFKPSLLIKGAINSPLAMELTTSFLYNEKIWFGAMYRHQESVGLHFIVNIIDNLKFGYAYDFGITDIQKYAQGSHELMLSFNMKKGSSQFLSPRFF